MTRFFIFPSLDLWTYSCVHLYARLQASEGPQATVPSNLSITSYRPNIVVYNSEASSVALLKLTCHLDSIHYIEAARSIKQNKTGFLQLLVEFELISIMKSVYWDLQPQPSLSCDRFLMLQLRLALPRIPMCGQHS